MIKKPQPIFSLRNGFTIMEIVASFSILAIVMVVVAQVASWCVHERHRNNNLFLANQAGLNVLEMARGTPYEKLDDNWAKAAQDIGNYKSLPVGCEIKVSVYPSKEFKLVKNVKVVVNWKNGRVFDPAECIVETSISPRSVALKGENGGK